MKVSHQFVTEAILLAVRDAAHADRMVTLFSRQFGKLQVVAYGSRLGKSRLGGCLQPFAHVRVLLANHAQQMPTIKQCEVIRSFRELREDIEHVAYASLLSELVCELWPEQQHDPDAYDTLLAAFATMVHRNPRLTALACGWQLLAHAGFQPQYAECVGCGNKLETGAGFSASHGGTICPACQDEPLSAFTTDMVALLHTLLNLNWKQPGQFTVQNGTLQAIERLFESYLIYHLEKPLKSLAFIRQLADCQTMDKQAVGGNNKENTPGG